MIVLLEGRFQKKLWQVIVFVLVFVLKLMIGLLKMLQSDGLQSSYFELIYSGERTQTLLSFAMASIKVLVFVMIGSLLEYMNSVGLARTKQKRNMYCIFYVTVTPTRKQTEIEILRCFLRFGKSARWFHQIHNMN